MAELTFRGRTVAIGGAMSAIGREIAAQFIAAGAQVHGADREIADAPQGLHASVLDLADTVAVRRWIGEIGRPVDILVNNAGGVVGQQPVALENLDDDAWNSVIAANLTTGFNLCRAVVAGMKRLGAGAIINIGSGASLQASLTGIQAYCTAKHAVLGLTRQLASELGPFGIRVNCVAPGFIITGNATRRQWDRMGGDRQTQLVQSIPLRRLGTPLDIANAVMLLASDQAAFISGQILAVNGGRT